MHEDENEEVEPLLSDEPAGHENLDLDKNFYGSEDGSMTKRKHSKVIGNDDYFYSLMLEKDGCGDYDPLSNRCLDHPTSNCDTMIHLLKGNIGTGILAMPDAFKNAGLTVGTIGTILIGIICVHTMHLLVNCAQELCRRSQVPALDFAHVAEASFKVGPPRLRKYSGLARTVVNAVLCVTQLGICCVYFVFVATNLREMTKKLLDSDSDMSVQTYMAFLLVPMIFLNWIRNLKLLAPFSMIANVFMGIGLGIIFYYIFRDLPSMHREGITVGFTSWKQLPLYFGTAVYAFEGIGVVLPLENAMKTPKDFVRWDGVLNKSMIMVALLYITIGFFGYVKYGDSVQGSVTLNLPNGALLAESVRLMMALSIFLSYALQFYVPIDIMWPSLKARISTEKMQVFGEYAFRTAFVLLTFTLAELIPDLKNFISLVGAVASSTLALTFPAIINILVNYGGGSGYGPYQWMLWKDVFIMLVGFIGSIAGTYASLEQIMTGGGESV